MKTLKRIITFATSLAILMLSTVSPIYAATFITNRWVNSNYLTTYVYRYMVTVSLEHKNKTIISAGDLRFSQQNCNNSLAVGSFGCGIETSQKSVNVHSVNAATYKVNVDVSTMLGTGGYMYVGTTTDTLTFVVVDRPFALDLDNIDLTRMRTTDGQFELIYEPGKELHYDATAAQRFSEKYGVSIEEIEKYNGIR